MTTNTVPIFDESLELMNSETSVSYQNGLDDPVLFDPGMTGSRFRRIDPRFHWRRSSLARMLILTSLFTVGISAPDYRREFRCSGASSLEMSNPAKKGKRISLREACRIAQRISEETDQAIQKEYLAEWKRYASLWEDDDLS